MPANEDAGIFPYKEYPNVPLIPLPEADFPDMSLGEAIKSRRSCRNYANTDIKLSELATILKTGYGIKGITIFENMEFFERMIPSGGGLYPLELYLIVNRLENVPQGVYHHSIRPPALEQITALEFHKFYISQLFMNQPYVADSGVILVVSSLFERNMKKYGDRGYRYMLYEAGHLFQNINLVATALGLGTLNLGGFFDHELAKLLKIDMEEEIPLYAMAIGARQGHDNTPEYSSAKI